MVVDRAVSPNQEFLRQDLGRGVYDPLMYDILLVIHILSAVVWIGGVVGFLVMVQDAKRRDGVGAADAILQRVERLMMPYLAGPLLVLATGITMVVMSDAWSFSQAWVLIALGLFVVGSLAFGGGRNAEKELEVARSEGDLATISDLSSRFVRSAGWSMAILASVEIFMVFKPGV